MVRDAEAADKLMPEALALVKDNAKLQKLSANISKMALRNAVGDIVDRVMQIVEQ